MENDFNKYIAFCSCICQKGLVRENNQDALVAFPQSGLFAISDGMGGGYAGDVASRLVVSNIVETWNRMKNASPGKRKYFFQQALQHANQSILAYAEEKYGIDDMGATVVAMLLDPWTAGYADICHVGDSRCYCYREKELFLLTEDHVAAHDVLTNVLGDRQKFFPDWQRIAVCPGDVYVLCSDGCSSYVDEQVIIDVLATEKPEMVAQKLEEKIIEAGAPDNYSIICFMIEKKLPADCQVSEADKQESDLLYSMEGKCKDDGRQ